MEVKNKQRPLEKLREILIEQNGMLFTADLAKHGIPRTYLSILETSGEIQKSARGVYSAANGLEDEMASLQARYKRAIFSHETALYFLGLTDRSPLSFSVTVPTGYNASPLKALGVKVYFIKPDLHQTGLAAARTPHGSTVSAYGLERTICDVLRSRGQMDIQLVNEALKRYTRSRERDLNLLYTYAQLFRVQKIVRATLEVLL